MLSRLRYTLRETFDSFRRNATLTVASIITAAISLLGVGLTLLSQHAFDNLLARWEGGVEMIVFMNPTATADQLTLVGDALTTSDKSVPIKLIYGKFKAWAEGRGMRAPWTQHALTRGLSERGLPIVRRSDGRHLAGYRLR